MSLGMGGLRELPRPLREALVDSDVVWALPISSPRRRWGWLFVTSGGVGVKFAIDDVEHGEAVTTQLALVLDGAELLARAVGVERSLAHAEKLAAVGELAARVAHEIRNPVTAARSLAQQLVREPVTPDSAESAALILGELERVERRVASLLRFARREDLRLEPVDVGELAHATLASFRTRLAAADVDLDLDAHSGVIATADREQLRQVLVNLVENALDALADADGPRRLAVAVGSVNGSAVVRVSDSGPGVPADALARLFEPFFSLKPTGTGLGLAIVRRTVEAHGGEIRARSSPGAGATFEVTLPLGGRAA
jgi:signal transduction histidine kinase